LIIDEEKNSVLSWNRSSGQMPTKISSRQTNEKKVRITLRVVVFNRMIRTFCYPQGLKKVKSGSSNPR